MESNLILSSDSISKTGLLQLDNPDFIIQSSIDTNDIDNYWE